MMNRRTLAVFSAMAVTLSACGHKEDATQNTTSTAIVPDATNTDDMTNTAAAESNMAMPAATAGQTFANTAAASDAFEVATSNLATTNAKSAAVRAFAKQMISAHTESTAKLKTLTSGLSPAITPDPTLTVDQQQALDDLKAKTGADFDTAYATAQVTGHQQTLDALKAYAAGGDVPALKDFASGLVPTVKAHLNMAKALKV